MATLEAITRGAAVKGILPDGLVTISDVRWIGTVAIEVTYKDSSGRLGNELLYRDREQERKFSALPPVILGGAMIVPAGLLRRLCGEADAAPTTFAIDT